MVAVAIAALLLSVSLCTADPLWVPVSFRGDPSNPSLTFAKVDMALRAEDPARYPMFKDLPKSDSKTVSLIEVARMLDESPAPLFSNAEHRDSSVMPPAVPNGFIFHEARVGSTLGANLFSAIDGALVYSESSAPSDVLNHCSGCTSDQQVRYLRTVIQAMIRLPGFTRSFFKFQSILTSKIELVLEAFPTVHWAFFYRNAVEVMVSNRKGPRGFSGPCVRGARSPPPGVDVILNGARPGPSAQYCAAHLAWLRTTALLMLESRTTGVSVNYGLLPDGFIDVIMEHMGVPLSTEEIRRMKLISTMYSKSRASPAAFSGDSSQKQGRASRDMAKWATEYDLPLHSRLVATGLPKHHGPAAALPTGVSDAVEDTPPAPQPSVYSTPVEPDPTTAVPNRRPQPLHRAPLAPTNSTVYPPEWPMKDILSAWNPDDTVIPDSYGQYNGLRYFDYQTELEEAIEYRNSEVPFIIRNIPNLIDTGHKWTDTYVTKHNSNTVRVETAAENHFMYHNGARGRGEKPPTQTVQMPFKEWAERATKKNHNLTDGEALYYLRISGQPKDQSFIGRDLTMFQSPSFFVVQKKFQRGIHCRFGQRSIIAEAHYDGGRNFIAMVSGRKRYILNHPKECPKLDMLKSGQSARHASYDWSDPANLDKFGDAKGIDVVIEAGDVLFVPAFWFHYIISLEKNIQCNTRSGTPGIHAKYIEDCGFSVRVTDKGVREYHPPTLTPESRRSKRLLSTLNETLSATSRTLQSSTLLLTQDSVPPSTFLPMLALPVVMGGIYTVYRLTRRSRPSRTL